MNGSECRNLNELAAESRGNGNLAHGKGFEQEAEASRFHKECLDRSQVRDRQPGRAAAGRTQPFIPGCRQRRVLSATAGSFPGRQIHSQELFFVEDGYSSVQEPEPGVPRQISLLRQCFVPPECTRYSVPSTELTPPLYPVYPLLYPPPAPSPAPKQSSFPDHPPTRGSVTSSSNNLHWFQNIEEVGLTADDDPDEHNKVPM